MQSQGALHKCDFPRCTREKIHLLIKRLCKVGVSDAHGDCVDSAAIVLGCDEGCFHFFHKRMKKNSTVFGWINELASAKNLCRMTAKELTSQQPIFAHHNSSMGHFVILHFMFCLSFAVNAVLRRLFVPPNPPNPKILKPSVLPQKPLQDSQCFCLA